MRVHARTRGYMRVHARTCGYTRVHVLTLNSMYLAHKWTEKWAKYATGEDAGSGAWTLGHAGSRGCTRVHVRTRGFTRVRVLMLNLMHKWTEEVRMDKIRCRRRRGFGRVDDRTCGFARVHARTFPSAYFGSLNAQRDRGSPYDGYNTPKRR